MNNNDLRILLGIAIDANSAIKSINTQISQLSQKVDAIKLNVTLDDKVTSQLNQLANATNTVKSATDGLNQVVKTEETVIRNLDGSIDKLVRQYLKSGDIIEKTKKTIDQNRQSKEADIAATIKLTEVESQYGQKLKEVQKLNSQGQLKGSTSTFGDNYNQTRVNTNADGLITNSTVTNNIAKQEKDIEKQEQLHNENLRKIANERKLIRQQLQALENTGKLTPIQQNVVNQSLASSKNMQDIQNIKNLMNQIESSIKAQTQYQQEQNKVLAQQYQQTQKIAEKEAIRVQNLGQQVGNKINANAFTGDYAQAQAKMEQYIKSVYGANTAITSLQRVTNSAGQEVWKYSASIDQGNKNTQAIKGNIDRTTSSMYEFSRRTQEVGNSASMWDRLGKSLGTFALYFNSMTVAMAGFSFFSKGIEYANELNKSLTEISIVTMQNQQEVAKLADEYQKLGAAMSVTTKEISMGAAEFYRQGLSQTEVMDKLKETTIYAKISSLDFKKAAEIITATTNSMGVSAQKAIDTFSYMGDATATGADEIGRAFQKVGGSASAMGKIYAHLKSFLIDLEALT
ncbi:phage tail tape measure protein [Bacillus pseudomycoides]|nr:phage tail tape measure protein [Bacillus pseudomycoides]